MRGQISIIGRGLDPSKHLSVDAIRHLRSADLILGIEHEAQTWTNLSKEFGFPQIQNIDHLYLNGAIDSENYQSYLSYIHKQALSCRNLVLLVAGHPRLGVSFIQMLRQQNWSKDFDIEIIEGISSFDVMINDLAIDPLEQGTAILDCNRLLLFEYQLEASINYFLYHACSVGTQQVNFLEPSKNNSIQILEDYLLRFFGEEKTIYMSRASNGSSERESYHPVALKDLAKSLDEIDFSTTLFIPAEGPSRLNQKFLNLLQEQI